MQRWRVPSLHQHSSCDVPSRCGVVLSGAATALGPDANGVADERFAPHVAVQAGVRPGPPSAEYPGHGSLGVFVKRCRPGRRDYANGVAGASFAPHIALGAVRRLGAAAGWRFGRLMSRRSSPPPSGGGGVISRVGAGAWMHPTWFPGSPQCAGCSASADVWKKRLQNPSSQTVDVFMVRTSITTGPFRPVPFSDANSVHPRLNRLILVMLRKRIMLGV